MTTCADLTEVLARLTSDSDWRCESLDSDRVLLTTGRSRADSEPVRLFVRLVEDSLLVSDGGEILNRLADFGFSLDDEVLADVWRAALRTYRVEESDGRVFLQIPLAAAAHGLRRMADALVALDALQIIAVPPTPRRTFVDEVEGFLRSSNRRVRRGPRINMGSGLTLSPALEVGTERGDVYVQPGAASSATQAFDHAFSLFTLAASRAHIAPDQRLSVLGGGPSAWSRGRLLALAEVSYVGFFEDRERIDRFLDGDVPRQTLMLPPHWPRDLFDA